MEELRHRVRRAYPIALAAARDGARDVFFIDQRYRNLKPIGGGSYGVVCAADDVNTGTRVALKKITHVFSDLVDAKRILREIKLLRHFDGHENIIAIRDIITVPPDTTDLILAS